MRGAFCYSGSSAILAPTPSPAGTRGFSLVWRPLSLARRLRLGQTVRLPTGAVWGRLMVAVHSRIRVILLGLGLAALAGCGGSEPGGAGAAAPSGEPYVIKFPHVVAQATPKGQMAQRFKELAEERFPGRVRVEVYPSAQLMEDTESIEALAFGEVQMIATSLSLFDRLTQKFQVFELPFLFPNLEAVERFQTSADGRALLSTLTDQGILGLKFWH